MKNEQLFIDQNVMLDMNGKELEGILTYPTTEGHHPAVILLHGSDRSGKDDPYYKEHAENIVQSGFAVLRYDGPGWGGGSAEGPGVETLKYRCEEAIAVVKYLQSRPEIQSQGVGLWGISQGGWICQMAAAAYDGIAFIIPVSGPGVTPAEQEVYRVEAESEAAGFDPDEVAKAVLMRRLMVDIILTDPVYKLINQSETARLGTGPWGEVIGLIYGREPIDPLVEFDHVIRLLNEIKNERWTKSLHLEKILPMFESLPPKAWELAKGQMRAVLEVNPADFLTKVHCPVLAIFGEADTSVPVDKSVTLYKEYLSKAGNNAVTIHMFPNANHTIQLEEEFVPSYFESIITWLTHLTFAK